MNIQITQKTIKEKCGTVSFKRGEAFYRSQKVTIEHYSSERCEATVAGVEDFHVTVEVAENGNFQATCSCPTLASVKKDCQHIAAVLLAIENHQRNVPNLSSGDELTNGLLTLFHEKPTYSSASQLHFEKRQVLDATFICKPVKVSKDQHLFGIRMSIGPYEVENIRDFLWRVSKGTPYQLTATHHFDPSLHCFQKETDAVLQELSRVTNDEKVYLEHLPKLQETLLLPPSTWERMLPILTMAPLVKLENGGQVYEDLHLSKEKLSLFFNLTEADTAGGKYLLSVTGFKQLIVMKDYHSVVYYGKIIAVKKDDCVRLSELKRMLDGSGTNQIPIEPKQLPFFLEKVVSGLRKIGEVKLPASVYEKFNKTPLIAKLYLDRVKNRLLASIEFHYDHVVINPLENREIKAGPMLVRDVAKEEAILQLMEDSEFATTEEGYYLHNEELEYEFLYHTVPKLQKLVQLYATTAVRNRIFRENTRPKIRVKVKKERTNWLEFKFDMDGIPEKYIKEVIMALEEKRKYYRLPSGGLLSLQTKEFEEIQRFLHALPVQEEDFEHQLDYPIVQGLKLLDSVNDQSTFTMEESFRQFLDNLSDSSSMQYTVPNSLESILRDYQKRGYQWMKTLASYGFGGILADDMGLGKTLQSITYLVSELPEIRKRKLPALIVCPSSLTYNWLSEIIKFAPEIQAIIIDGTKAARAKLQKELGEIDVIITSYPLLRSDLNWFEKHNFHTVFFDEAQAFKNPVTQTARAVKRIKADHRFALTGTPVENSIEELWSIFHVVFPELFMGLKEYSHLSRKKIARRIRPFLLRRLKEDVLAELPEKLEMVQSVELLPDQKKLYAAYLAKLRHDTLKHLDKDTIRKNRIKILAGLTRLRQICCHPALFVDGYKGSSAKFDMLLQIIEESKLSGRRVLIFSQFTKMLKLIGNELSYQGVPFFYLDGQTPSEERVETCKRFNEGERDYFLISLKAGGTGLNLTGADTVILYDIWWNPAVEEQAADRAHRIGQTNVVQVIKLVARGTIEDKMNELQEKKKHLIEEIIQDDGKASTALTEEDIREILMI
ncbi:DEAD/DEAH box helicase [Sutcliffiella deserti]|uniref:DEAD/DEAH box helicase n=1 Tax=Sutcliffiella deserti TaxID=2875501 RepID=UPI001CBFFD63|nr:DEAD/DEAH box helicase [Sutcliffiella deserti]